MCVTLFTKRAEGEGGRRKEGKEKGERDHDGTQESTPLYHPNLRKLPSNGPKGRLMLKPLKIL